MTNLKTMQREGKEAVDIYIYYLLNPKHKEEMKKHLAEHANPNK